jgi:chromosomal replication initiator protein
MDKKELTRSIVQIVSNYFGVEISDVSGRCRKAEVVDCRDVLIYFLRIELGDTFTEIGDFLSKNQSTIVRAFTRARKKMKKDGSLQRDCQRIKEKIKFILK